QVISYWEKQLSQVLPNKPDLIVLPEGSDQPGGLTMEEKLAYLRVRKNQILDFFASIARNNNCYIVYGTNRLLEDGTRRNSSVIIDRKGEIAGIYDKNFPMVGEIDSGVVPGNETPVFQCDFGTVACAICFDLNFVELRDAYAQKRPDIILFSSMYHGGQMQANWAYTCRSFFVGAIGDGELPSEIRNPQGEIIATSTNYFNFAITTINLDTEIAHLDYNWSKIRSLRSKYGNSVVVSEPGHLGSVLITSQHEKISALDMVKEFDIELLDDYFKRSREYRRKQFEPHGH
ncbi:MAG: carbon-nitrogen hydrolase family protein, partial [Prolixibacteraceae bacterium]